MEGRNGKSKLGMGMTQMGQLKPYFLKVVTTLGQKK
jgi:hypothetical protein